MVSIIDLYFKEIGQKFLSHEVFRSQNVKINHIGNSIPLLY